jgi:hypothetical protein
VFLKMIIMLSLSAVSRLKAWSRRFTLLPPTIGLFFKGPTQLPGHIAEQQLEISVSTIEIQRGPMVTSLVARSQ